SYEIEAELEARGKEKLLELVRGIKPSHVNCFYVRQPEALGLGHAVLCAEKLVHGEPFAVILADDLLHGEQPVLKQLVDVFEPFHRAGLQLHVHTNGDEATDVVLDAMTTLLARHPRPDHRHTLQHCQMADAAQLKRVRALGMCVN
ncbi:amidohydrolase family protein, partial [Bacillus subtilis]|nr:amidohydrolase family protein [Bacillus subtilis]